MKKNVLFLVAVALLFACNKQSKEKKTNKLETEQTVTTKHDDSKFGRKNFSVVWKWSTVDKKLVEENLVAISDEMTKLWKANDIENAYYNSDSKIDKLEFFPNISYFLKAKSLNEAKEILNNLLIVKKGIAKYTIYPVGTKWFGRKTDTIHKKGITKSYVSVWSTLKEIDLNNEKDFELIQKQANKLTSLFNEGIIENVYWELSGEPDAEKRRTNEITDFVFFVNANSEEEARKICNNLPLTKNSYVSYKLLPVGVFWFGEHK